MDSRRPTPPSYPADDAPVAPPYPAPFDPTTAYVMPGDPDYDARLARAQKRVAEVRGFYRSLAAFAGVSLLLLVINRLTGGGWWFLWVTFFWGISVAMQAWNLFGPARFLDTEWEARRIQEEMRRR